MFSSVYHRYNNQDATSAEKRQAWPGLYRDEVPSCLLEDYQLQVGVEKQTPRLLNLTQLKALPSFNEQRQLVSKTGWAYRGNWKGLTFQTLFSLFSTPHLYEWIRLESLTGDVMVVPRQELVNWRLLYECDGHPLTPLYGGPLWVHHFDFYCEFGFPHLKSMTLLQSGQYEWVHPKANLGYHLEHAKIDAGQYFLIHEERVLPLGHLGRKL